ncbi:hypothetical protein ARMSODRAFT_988562 [Armillaria solidipes]|uniref:DNA/RNA polymerase n=1 Tax=Armillaria solidipes TaxID=1076256 RepID=A0A2H3BTB2_9AGAR|nr:hypothetical protein ARMSODRAFT_988562 [Armillaria solidipes]
MLFLTRSLSEGKESQNRREKGLTIADVAVKLADDGTLGLALQRMESANTGMFVRAAKATTSLQNAPASLRLTDQGRRGGKELGEGRFGGGMEFGERGWENDVLYAPKPSEYEFQNSAATNTIAAYPHLFKLTTPIKIDEFAKLLRGHPNQPFVQSVVRSLREGFWPWANTHHAEDFPVTWDNSRMVPNSEMEQKFIISYRNEEIAAGRFSENFGPELLPGMYSTPVHAVPKPHSDDLRMVSNMSAGSYAPNQMIQHADIAGARMDTLRDFFAAIRKFKLSSPENAAKKLYVFKSDISKAYRLCPMHPLWQLKQVVTTGYLTDEQKAAGQTEVLSRSVDGNNNFGGRGSFRVFYSVNGLITWVAVNVEGIEDIFVYVDDDWGFDVMDNLEYYEPYDDYFPGKQVKLLKLWDRLGVPHARKKQLYGFELTVIGYEVDPNAMTATMPSDSKSEFVLALRQFAKSNRRTLQEFQQISGWSNWSFNVFPLFKPGLSSVYEKMAGKSNSFALISLSKAVKDDISWMADHIEASSGIFCFDSEDWHPINDATTIIMCDACLDGMGFWLPRISTGFVCPTPSLPNDDPIIFFFEALCVCAALHWAANNLSPALRKRLTIKTDNQNTVDIFNSLKATPFYNTILKSAVDILVSHDIDLRVVHVPGLENERAKDLVPDLIILPFLPPRDVMGAIKC